MCIDTQKKHLKEYEEMLAASRQAAKKKEAARQAKRQAKEAAATQALHVWEKDILPNWKAVLRKDNLRQVWWSGTMPPRYRARFWQSCIGNSLVLGKSKVALLSLLRMRLKPLHHSIIRKSFGASSFFTK